MTKTKTLLAAIMISAGVACAETDYVTKPELWSIQKGADNAHQIRTLRVAGSGTIGGDLVVTGDVTVDDVTVGDDMDVVGDLTAGTVASDGVLSGATLSVTGAASLATSGGNVFMSAGGGGVAIGTNNIATGASLQAFATDGAAYSRIVSDAAPNEDSQLSFMEYGSTKWSIGNDATDDSLHINNAAGAFSAASEMVITSGGNVGIGTNAPAAKLHVAGNAIMSTNYLYYVDAYNWIGTWATATNLYYGCSTGTVAGTSVQVTTNGFAGL